MVRCQGTETLKQTSQRAAYPVLNSPSAVAFQKIQGRSITQRDKRKKTHLYNISYAIILRAAIKFRGASGEEYSRTAPSQHSNVFCRGCSRSCSWNRRNAEIDTAFFAISRAPWLTTIFSMTVLQAVGASPWELGKRMNLNWHMTHDT